MVPTVVIIVTATKASPLGFSALVGIQKEVERTSVQGIVEDVPQSSEGLGRRVECHRNWLHGALAG